MSTLLPPSQLCEIACNCVRKYCSEHSSDFDDFRQEVLLGILERQSSYNSGLSTSKRFVITVAQQIAKRCFDEYCFRQRQISTNHQTQLSIRANTIEAYEADYFGFLVAEDDGLNFIQLTVFLSQAELTVLVLRLSRYSHKRIRQQLCITKIRYSEILNGLKTWVNKIFANYKKFFSI